MSSTQSTTPAPNKQCLTVSEAKALPSTLAGLLRTAIDDARSLDQSLYVPHFDNWHFVNVRDLCEICLAGGIIAGSLHNPPSMTLDPNYFSRKTEDKLRAVDAMRSGDWTAAFRYVYDFAPDRNLFARLRALPAPHHDKFCDWPNFERHLDSLESVLPALTAIDELASNSS